MFINSTSPFPYIDVSRSTYAFAGHVDTDARPKVLYAGTGSTGGTIAMVSIITALNICANLSIVAGGSRQAFAFARDEGLPFSSWFRQVHTIGTPIPVNAILASLFITVIVSLLNLGSATAFNSVVGLLTGSGGVSYTVSIGCVLWRRMYGAPLPKAPFSLGKWVSSIEPSIYWKLELNSMLGDPDQRPCYRLLPFPSHYELLPYHSYCRSRDDELRRGHVCRRGMHIHGLLRREGPSCLQGTCGTH